jgi:hypothetical protein
MRISRDVEVVEQSSLSSSEILVLSDTPPVVGEVLTLALMSHTTETECLVKVVESRPHVADGVMRHLVRLEILSAPFSAGSAMTELERD